MDFIARLLITAADTEESGALVQERPRRAIRESDQRSESALRRFRSALDASADMVLLIDVRRRRFIDFNATACRQLGYSRAELLGLAPGELGSLVTDGEDGDGEVATCRRKDGSAFTVEARRVVHETAEGPIVVVAARDLTERKAADERYAAQLRYQKMLARFGQAALDKREPKDLIAEAIETVVHGLGADAVVYVEPGPQPGELFLRAGVGYDGELMACAAGNAVEMALASSEPFIGTGSALPFAWARGQGSAAIVAVRGDNTVRGALLDRKSVV